MLKLIILKYLSNISFCIAPKNRELFYEFINAEEDSRCLNEWKNLMMHRILKH